MRYPAEHKEAVRARIVEATSRALRESGLDGVSIPALMKAVGLTHGGFYSHFRERDELVADAATFSANETVKHVFSDSKSVPEMLARYLSNEHVEHPAQGCVLAALGPEAVRQKPAVRRTFGELARGFLRHVDRKLRGNKGGPVSDEALVLASKMIGGVVLARMVDDAELARRILSACRSST